MGDTAAGQGEYRLIVVGSGISGLFVALEAARLGPVLVITKGSIDDCNTRWAQGGIAAAVGATDSPEAHFRDTVAAGAGLVDEGAARILAFEAAARVRDLVDHGVEFDSLGGEVALGREAAHSEARILHAGGDRTGAEIETALSAAALRPGITVLDHTYARRVLTEGGRVVGVESVDLRTGEVREHGARAVLIASGGAGQLYTHTTNPDVATGDGVALAFDAGAEVTDLEFYQFHPTAFRRAGAPPFLISEAVRGEGATLRNARGEAFMVNYNELGDLAPRDVVARAIVSEMEAAGRDHVELDCTGLTDVDLAARFPSIYAFCRSMGIDMARELIPVAPAAHYMMGGVRTDTWGRTTVPGLYACGEAACTGVHGANRLASNSLMETVVFGKRVVEHLTSGAGGAAEGVRDAIPFGAVGAAPSRERLQALLWGHAGIERDEARLSEALEEVRGWRRGQGNATDRGVLEDGALALTGAVLLDAALRRTESRGAHYRRDFLERDDTNWRRHLVYVRAD